MNIEGKQLLVMVEDNKRLYILNGNKKGNEEGKFTYVQSNTSPVADFVITNIQGWKTVRKMKLEAGVKSDKHPIRVHLKSRIKKELEKNNR